MNYHVFTESATDPESLARLTADFLEQEFNLTEFILLKHVPHPEPFLLLKNHFTSFDFSEWKKEISGNSIKINKTLYLEYTGLFYFFSGKTFGTENVYIFLFKTQPDVEIKNILDKWQLRHRYLLRVQKSLITEHETIHGNLISQLLHDVQSLMDFQPQEINDPDLSTRLTYQNSVNENLLFYVRPIELLTFKSPVAELIYASVQILGIERGDFSLRISGKIADIDLDAELFSKALNAIILNAQESADGDPVEWEIRIEQIHGTSPFIDHDWLLIFILDKGPGISADYLPFIFNPFFTTKKVAGYSGFGLTCAKKILEAHGGHLQITSEKDQGSEVKLIFPYRDDETKNTDY